MKKILTLWDIDGTLVNINKFHVIAFRNAIDKVYGVKINPEKIYNYFGLSAITIVNDVLKESGLSENEIMPRIKEAVLMHANEINKLLNTLKREEIVLPGVENTLEELKKLKIEMAIVTGNSKGSGEAILKTAGLLRFFNRKINYFGGNIDKRSLIVSKAIESSERYGFSVKEGNIFVFGDTPEDIIAAKQNGCKSIAIIRNSVDSELVKGNPLYERRKRNLLREKPEFIVDELTDTEKIIGILNSD